MSLKCGKCHRIFGASTELRSAFPAIPELFERIEPGDMVPFGECPSCGSLVWDKDTSSYVACNICGVEVEYECMREHLRLHNRNALDMSYPDVRTMFTGKWDSEAVSV